MNTFKLPIGKNRRRRERLRSYVSSYLFEPARIS